MAKIHGKNAAIYVAGYDLSGRLNEVTMDISVDLADAFAFQDAAKEYVEGQHSWTIALRGLFDGAASNIDEVLHNLIGTAAEVATILPEGDGLVKKGYGGEGELSARSIRVPSTSIVEVSANITGSKEMARLTRIHKADVVESGVGPGVDMGAGGEAIIGVLHITAIEAATTLNVYFEHSDDDGVLDPYAALSVGFGNKTAIGGSRYRSVETVKRWLRARWTLTVGKSATFIVLAEIK
jgi:hypothetical protein